MRILHVFTLAITAESFFDGQFKYLTDNGEDITLACSPNDYIDDFVARNGIGFIPIEIPRKISPLTDIKTIINLVQIIKNQKFDIVVGHTPKGALLAMMAAKLAGVKKKVYFRHGVVYTTAKGVKRTILKMEEKFVSSLATIIVNVSPSLGELMVRDKINISNKQTIIERGTCGGIDTINTFNPNTIDDNLVSVLRNTLGISQDNYVIGFCGRLCKDKGIPELIAGFQLFRDKNPDANAKLLLVGGYDSRDILPEDIHQTIDSDKDIIHTGHIIKNIQNYYALMDVFMFPSHREGFGMCSIEAQAMGVPALVARSHGCVDTIIESETGLYINLTPEGISEKIEVMHNRKLRERLGKNARLFVCNNYERTKLWPKIHLFYNSI